MSMSNKTQFLRDALAPVRIWGHFDFSQPILSVQSTNFDAQELDKQVCLFY